MIKHFCMSDFYRKIVFVVLDKFSSLLLLAILSLAFDYRKFISTLSQLVPPFLQVVACDKLKCAV
jgi:hypothetical protein